VDVASVLLPELLDDITMRVNEDISHILTGIPVGVDEEIPGITFLSREYGSVRRDGE
jgi:hypothetical protein